MKSILVVDDEPHVIRVLRLSLERAGYRVREAADGDEALAEIHTEAPDLMISDIDMPETTGKDLCLTLSEEMPHRSWPIYVLTSRAETEHREWASQLPNLRFFEKPISIRQLLSDLQDDLVNQRGE